MVSSEGCVDALDTCLLFDRRYHSSGTQKRKLRDTVDGVERNGFDEWGDSSILDNALATGNLTDSTRNRSLIIDVA